MDQLTNMGDEVKDSVTGFTGIIIGKTLWLHGCTRCIVQPKVGKDGKLPESATFDEPQLVVIKKAAKKEGNHKNGGYDLKVSQKDEHGR